MVDGCGVILCGHEHSVTVRLADVSLRVFDCNHPMHHSQQSASNTSHTPLFRFHQHISHHVILPAAHHEDSLVPYRLCLGSFRVYS